LKKKDTTFLTSTSLGPSAKRMYHKRPINGRMTKKYFKGVFLELQDP
jgi:hypothetical protein